MSALNSSDKIGSISVHGGNIEIGQANGRTILLAGTGEFKNSNPPEFQRNELKEPENGEDASNLTLIDGSNGIDSNNIRITSGLNGQIKIFSGPSNQSGTTLRGSDVTARKDASTNVDKILVGGRELVANRQGELELRPVSAFVSLSNSTKLTASEIYVGSTQRSNDRAQFFGIKEEISPNFNLDYATLSASLSNLKSKGNRITYKATGDSSEGSGYIRVVNNPTSPFHIRVEASNNTAAQIKFFARDEIEFQGAGISIVTAEDSRGGLFSLTSEKGGISLLDSELSADGAKGDIFLKTTNKLILLENSKLSTILTGSGLDKKAGVISIQGDILKLANNSIISAETRSQGLGGELQINVGNVILGEKSELTTAATNTGNAGVIKINSNLGEPRDLVITLSGGSTIQALTQYNGGLGQDNPNQQAEGGDILIGSPNKNLTISGLGFITAETKGTGKGGFLDLKGSSITLGNGAEATAATSGSGPGGQILVDTSSLTISGDRDVVTKLTTEARNTGKAGQITIGADPTKSPELAITFSGTGKSLISAKTTSPGSGKGGDVSIGFANQILSISGSGEITAETEGSGQGGSIDLKGSSITLDQGVKATTATSGSGEAGKIVVDTSSLTLSGGSKLTTEAASTGNAGQINLGTTNGRPVAIAFSGGSQINAKTRQQAAGGGKGGTITIGSANQPLTLSGPSFITAETEGSGPGGSLNLRGSSITLDQGIKATTEASGSGQGGTINVNAARLNLDNQAQINSNTSSSGNGGLIALNASTLTLNNNSLVTARTTGSGRGGTVRLEGNTITLDGGSRVSAESGNGFDAATASGPAGSIFINANGPNSLHLFKGSAITASTYSNRAFTNAADLGNIFIFTPNLELDGLSRISTQSFGSAQGGNISIKAGRLQLNGGSVISAAGSGKGQAGNINLSVDNTLTLSRGSQINASTRSSSSGRGGANIAIEVGKDLLLFGNSSITAQALENASGGNLDLFIPNGFLRAAFPVDGPGNDILAIAFGGDGGRINIRALGVFGVNFNTFLKPISEASSRSVSGRDGVLAIFTPQLNPDRGIEPIEQPLDPSNTLDQSCSPRAENSSFRACGRGGVAPQPGETNARPAPLDDLGTLPEPPLVNTAPASLSPLR